MEIHCDVYNARITRDCCQRNLDMAIACGELIRTASAGCCLLIDEVYLDRLAGCSQCPKCPDSALHRVYVDAFTRDITIICDDILEPTRTTDEWEKRERTLAKYKRYDEKRRRAKASQS